MLSRDPADTPHNGPAHTDQGVKGLLAAPAVYRIFGRALGGARAATRFVHGYVKPFPRCRILDLGCGPGDLPIYLGDSIGEYLGIDINPEYIEAARERWKGDRRLSFTCVNLSTMDAPRRDYYDIVIALGIVHHLDDASARRMFAIAHDALAPAGRPSPMTRSTSPARTPSRGGSFLTTAAVPSALSKGTADSRMHTLVTCTTRCCTTRCACPTRSSY